METTVERLRLADCTEAMVAGHPAPLGQRHPPAP